VQVLLNGPIYLTPTHALLQAACRGATVNEPPGEGGCTHYLGCGVVGVSNPPPSAPQARCCWRCYCSFVPRAHPALRPLHLATWPRPPTPLAAPHLLGSSQASSEGREGVVMGHERGCLPVSVRPPNGCKQEPVASRVYPPPVWAMALLD